MLKLDHICLADLLSLKLKDTPPILHYTILRRALNEQALDKSGDAEALLKQLSKAKQVAQLLLASCLDLADKLSLILAGDCDAAASCDLLADYCSIAIGYGTSAGALQVRPSPPYHSSCTS